MHKILSEDFEHSFQDIDLPAEAGGYQQMKELADGVMRSLTNLKLNEPEQLYVLVAFLRALKVYQCVRADPSTSGLNQILLSDVQAHLV